MLLQLVTASMTLKEGGSTNTQNKGFCRTPKPTKNLESSFLTYFKTYYHAALVDLLGVPKITLYRNFTALKMF